MNKNSQALVSIIITTKNEEKNIGRLLKSIAEQTYPDIETIVVDNNSTDNTQHIIESLKIQNPTSKIFLYNKGPERSAQRNYGAKKAKGKYLLFLDADMELSKDIVKECILLSLSAKKLGGIIIPEISIAKNFWEKVKAFERSFYFEDKNSNVEAARFFPMEIFKSVGGYDEAITGPEDWDLPETIKKKGWTIYRIHSVLFHYESIPSLWSLAKKKYYYGLRAHKYLSKQQTGVTSSKTLYFLRPVFYKYPKKYLKHPIISLGMIWMLSVELLAGGLGFLKGKIKNL